MTTMRWLLVATLGLALGPGCAAESDDDDWADDDSVDDDSGDDCQSNKLGHCACSLSANSAPEPEVLGRLIDLRLFKRAVSRNILVRGLSGRIS